MKAVILGATRGMGRALARQLVERGDQVFLLGREPDDLARSVADLQIRGDVPKPEYAVCDLLNPQGFGDALDRAQLALGGFDAVILTAGVFDRQEVLEEDADLRDRLLRSNFVGSIHFCEEARRRLLAAGGGKLCVFSSVAGERARKPVTLYGATKAGLTYYLNGLDHRYRERGLHVLIVKPGFIRTSMTANLNPPPFAGEPEAAARDVLKALDAGSVVVYTPPIWRWVMWVIRNLPRAVMRRIGF